MGVGMIGGISAAMMEVRGLSSSSKLTPSLGTTDWKILDYRLIQDVIITFLSK